MRRIVQIGYDNDIQVFLLHGHPGIRMPHHFLDNRMWPLHYGPMAVGILYNGRLRKTLGDWADRDNISKKMNKIGKGRLR